MKCPLIHTQPYDSTSIHKFQNLDMLPKAFGSVAHTNHACKIHYVHCCGPNIDQIKTTITITLFYWNI